MVVNDFLDFGRLQANRLRLEPVPFQLRDTLANTVNALAVLAQRKGFDLALQVSDDVPDALVGDPGRLRQIVLNLVENGIKFTGRGEVAVRVKLESEEETRVVLRFQVSDTGIGIALDRQRSIFEPFSRLEARGNPLAGGSGLGLALCRRFVEMMDGRLEMESEPGHGSTFHLTIPFARASVDAMPLHGPDVRGLAVLVVAYAESHLRLLTRVLSYWGMKPRAVTHSSAAIECVERASSSGEPLTLAILDSVPGERTFSRWPGPCGRPPAPTPSSSSC